MIAGALHRILAQPFAPPATALAGLRGGGDADTTTYTAAGMRLTVSVQRGGSGSRHSVLVGLIEQASGALAGARAQLFKGAELLQTENVDELGNFLFANVSPGIYRIEVFIPHAIVEIDPVQVP